MLFTERVDCIVLCWINLFRSFTLLLHKVFFGELENLFLITFSEVTRYNDA